MGPPSNRVPFCLFPEGIAQCSTPKSPSLRPRRPLVLPCFDGPGNHGGLLASFCGAMIDPLVKGSFVRGSPIFKDERRQKDGPSMESQAARKAYLQLAPEAMDDLIEKLVNNPKIDDRTEGHRGCSCVGNLRLCCLQIRKHVCM